MLRRFTLFVNEHGERRHDSNACSHPFYTYLPPL